MRWTDAPDPARVQLSMNVPVYCERLLAEAHDEKVPGVGSRRPMHRQERQAAEGRQVSAAMAVRLDNSSPALEAAPAPIAEARSVRLYLYPGATTSYFQPEPGRV